MDDLISRQAAIDATYDVLASYSYIDEPGSDVAERVEDILKEMPSVQPEQKTGRWIFQTITHGKRMWCSNCNSAFDLCCNQIKRYDEATKKDYLWVYCPWCGAKMEDDHYATT